jgi:murein DD-endopeptidase MepM/ murein hydrolase activator NlpD
MQLVTDLQFIYGLYKRLERRYRLLVSGLLVAVVLFPVLLMLTTGFGLLTGKAAEAAPASYSRNSQLPEWEPPLPYIPPTPTIVWPAHGTITAPFGVRTPAQAHHSGIDIAGKYGDPVTAFKSGKVIVADRSAYNHTGLGRYVMVDHGNDLVSVYGHLSSINVSVGQAVTTQTVVGKEGATGEAFGVHLHFEIRLKGKPVNPAPYLPGPRP